MNLLKSLVFILFFSNSFSQKLDIKQISVSYINSARIGNNSNIRIALADNNLYSEKTVTVYIYIDDKTKDSFEISKAIFNKIVKQILKIKPKDIILNDTNFFTMDAATTTLSFGAYIREVSYSVYDLSKADEKTSKKKMLKIVQQILEIGKIKIPEIN
jgi:hypothetical protein